MVTFCLWQVIQSLLLSSDTRCPFNINLSVIIDQVIGSYAQNRVGGSRRTEVREMLPNTRHIIPSTPLSAHVQLGCWFCLPCPPAPFLARHWPLLCGS